METPTISVPPPAALQSPPPPPSSPPAATQSPPSSPPPSSPPSHPLHLPLARPSTWLSDNYFSLRPLSPRNPQLTLRINRRHAPVRQCIIREQPLSTSSDGSTMYFTIEHVILHELQRLRRCPSILPLFDYWIDTTLNTTYLETEYCDGGDLASIIQRIPANTTKALGDVFILHVLIHIASAVIYLETGRVYDFEEEYFTSEIPWTAMIHRDITPSHILFRVHHRLTSDPSGFPEPVLGGFTNAIPDRRDLPSFLAVYEGVERKVADDWQLYLFPEIFTHEATSDFTLNDTYAPPEYHTANPNRKTTWDRTSNIFQLGASIFHLATSSPFPRSLSLTSGSILPTPQETIEFTLEQHHRPHALIQILTPMLYHRPQKRPSVHKLLNILPLLVDLRDALPLEKLPNWAFVNLPLARRISRQNVGRRRMEIFEKEEEEDGEGEWDTIAEDSEEDGEEEQMSLRKRSPTPRPGTPVPGISRPGTPNNRDRSPSRDGSRDRSRSRSHSHTHQPIPTTSSNDNENDSDSDSNSEDTRPISRGRAAVRRGSDAAITALRDSSLGLGQGVVEIGQEVVSMVRRASRSPMGRKVRRVLSRGGLLNDEKETGWDFKDGGV